VLQVFETTFVAFGRRFCKRPGQSCTGSFPSRLCAATATSSVQSPDPRGPPRLHATHHFSVERGLPFSMRKEQNEKLK